MKDEGGRMKDEGGEERSEEAKAASNPLPSSFSSSVFILHPSSFILSAMKFLHAADLHLDSPLRGLEAYDGAPVEKLRSATRRAMENLVRLAIEERVDFVLIAGDVYDGDWPDYGAGLFFAARMSELGHAGIPVFLISGNHDAASRITRCLRLPENVCRLSDHHAETRHLDDFGVAIHGRGFAQRAAPDDFSAAYPAAVKGLFNIGLLHTSANGRPGHDDYAPCTVEGLRARGYDYWALGHVHTRETLCREEPWIVFPGVLQGRHARECGPKGCMIVEVEDSQVAAVRECHLDVFRWHVCEVDAAGCAEADAVLERVRESVQTARAASDGRSLAIRVNIGGACAAHDALDRRREHWISEIRAAATDASAGEAWIEKVQFRTAPARRPSPAAKSAPINASGSLRSAIEALTSEAEAAASGIFSELSDLDKKLRSDLGKDFAGLEFDLAAPELRGELLSDVQRLLLSRLCAADAD
jgi:exonuclease SbcD